MKHNGVILCTGNAANGLEGEELEPYELISDDAHEASYLATHKVTRGSVLGIVPLLLPLFW